MRSAVPRQRRCDGWKLWLRQSDYAADLPGKGGRQRGDDYQAWRREQRR